MNTDGLDKLDYAILAELKENARMSYSDIGEKVGLSRVQSRIELKFWRKMELYVGIKPLLMKQELQKAFHLFLMLRQIQINIRRWWLLLPEINFCVRFTAPQGIVEFIVLDLRLTTERLITM